MENQKSNKKTVWLVIIVLVVAAIAISVFLSSSSDDPATPEPAPAPADGSESPDPADGEQGGADDQDSQPADQQPEASPEGQDADSISANIGSLMATGQQLEADLDAAIAAGCGDDLGAFNQTVIDLATRLGAYQESLLGAFPSDPGQVSAETAAQLNQLQAVTESVQTKNESLADISNDCNNQ